ncbi:MAG: Sec-independent protein translocase subunit TatA/TatB [Armatimonadota bacterium]
MFNLGTPEIVIILAVALLVFGPKKLPEIGKSIGQGLRELRKASREIVDSVNTDYDEPEPKKETVNDATSGYRDP